MPTTRVVVVILILLALPTVEFAFTGKGNGNDLREACTAFISVYDTGSVDASMERGGWCAGLLHGIVGMNSMYKGLARYKMYFCPPEGYTNGQGIRIVVAYLNKHPERLHMDATTLVVHALHEAFPCTQATEAKPKP